jgi:hypothetical protein
MVNITWKGSPNHYSGRGGYSVSYITLHVMAGGLPGTDATFAKASAQASSHYGVGANGDIHQYVKETDGSWADGSSVSNKKSITIEHAGGLVGYPNTDACVEASAQLCADIARRYGWKQLVHGQNVFLHREIPPYTHPACPDRTTNPLRWPEIIARANVLLSGGSASGNTNTKTTGDDDMPYAFVYAHRKGSDGRGAIVGPMKYFDGQSIHPLAHGDELKALQMTFKNATGKELPSYTFTTDAWMARFEAAAKRIS